jgi:phospholipase/carboxylesterase
LQGPCSGMTVYVSGVANPICRYCYGLRWCILAAMPAALLNAIEINPPGQPRACLIWLHGLGANGHDFAPLIPELGIVRELGVRVVLPHAPVRSVTINAGMVMPAWYDIPARDFLRNEDVHGIRQSQQQIMALIEREVTVGVLPQHIVLAGFSQGGAIALHTGLRYPQPLGGILALSTYLPLPGLLDDEASPANASVPIMLAHGSHDPVVPLVLAERARELLTTRGHAVEWHVYPMPHSVCPAEVQDIRKWLVARLG